MHSVLVSIWEFDSLLVRPFPIYGLDFGYHIDAFNDHIRNPPIKCRLTQYTVRLGVLSDLDGILLF